MYFHKRLFVAICWIYLLKCCFVSSQDVGGGCTDQTTCSSCLMAGPLCAWCTQLGFDEVNVRCDTVERLSQAGCNNSNVVDPASFITHVKNEDPKNADGGRPAIQLAPQEVNISLRTGIPYKFEVNFRQAENYPVDLYYLMDLSNSMADDKTKLAELGDLLAEEMAKITNNFHLGFGSFVDKKTSPYVSTTDARLAEPCDGCAPPYGFRNDLPLTRNTSQFRVKVLGTQISGNLDGPEGGLDAIMQTVACHKEIGWREKSRKMIVFSTDAGFHFAGDGKLGGIVTPNDGQCHLNSSGEYNETLSQDYPSIGHLAHTIAANKVNVIFAVTREVTPIYEALGDVIYGSTVGELADDSSNVVNLVRENYNKISSTVELKAEDVGDVQVSFRAKCNSQGYRDIAFCDKLGIGQNVTFEVSIEVKSCPKDPTEMLKTFSIYPVGLTDRLTINLDLICECDCEQPEYEEPLSANCNGTGTYECGACTCAEGTYGKQCECSADNVEGNDNDVICRKTNTSEVCEGRGQCVCGRCDCYPITSSDPSRKYKGAFCECNNYACDHFDGQPCGGPNRGNCQCGKCECLPGFTGRACDCSTDTTTCMAKESGLMCNNKGSCECGVCNCHLDNFYSGPTCEDCPVCPGKCDENKACVQCTAFHSGDLTQEYCQANCTHVKVVDYVKDMPNRKICKFRDSDYCDFYFSYGYFSDNIEVQRTKECPAPVNVKLIVGLVVGGVILIGLLLLIIGRVMVYIYDKRELARFEKEQKKAKWREEDNPIYQEATSKFQNPAYCN